jgi:hypothetical protein
LARRGTAQVKKSLAETTDRALATIFLKEES